MPRSIEDIIRNACSASALLPDAAPRARIKWTRTEILH